MSNYDPNQPGQPYDPAAGSSNPANSPYGQNPYGQNPYGQNPYGQAPQPQVPNFDQYQQQGGYAPVQPPAERPKTLQWAFLLILASGILSAISTWLMSSTHFFSNLFRSNWSLIEVEVQSQIEATTDPTAAAELQRMLENPNELLAMVDSAMATAAVVGVIISLIAYFLVGYFVGRGVNPLRIIATILAGFSLLGLISSVSMISMYANAADATTLNTVLVLGTLAGVAGVVFSWLPASSKYIAQRRMARRAGFR